LFYLSERQCKEKERKKRQGSECERLEESYSKPLLGLANDCSCEGVIVVSTSNDENWENERVGNVVVVGRKEGCNRQDGNS